MEANCIKKMDNCCKNKEVEANYINKMFNCCKNMEVEAHCSINTVLLRKSRVDSYVWRIAAYYIYWWSTNKCLRRKVHVLWGSSGGSGGWRGRAERFGCERKNGCRNENPTKGVGMKTQEGVWERNPKRGVGTKPIKGCRNGKDQYKKSYIFLDGSKNDHR